MITSMNNLLSGHLTINGTISQNNGTSAIDRLANGLTIAGRDDRKIADLADLLPEAQKANEDLTTDNVADTESGNKSVYENFAAEITKRCEEAQKDDPTSAKILSDSLISTADSIKQIFGQNHANAFMSRVLAATDSGVNESQLMDAINGVFGDMRSGASEKQVFDLMDALNYGLDAIFEDEENIAAQVDVGGAQYGLSFALNKFFQKDVSFWGDNMTMAETNGFDFNLQFTQMGIVRPDENGECWVRVNTGRSATASELVGSEAIAQTVSYLRESLGNENAASYLEGLRAGSNVMDAIATSIAIVAQENGQESAERYIQFLNENIAPALSSTADNLSFNGWTLDPAPDDTSTGKSDGGLKIGHAEMDSMLKAKGHQGFTTSWTDRSSGVTTTRQMDLTDLYEQYLGGGVATIPDPEDSDGGPATLISFKKPQGNLVDITV